jgi:hypothetical protein
LEVILQELLGLPISHTMEEGMLSLMLLVANSLVGYAVECYSNGQWGPLIPQNFDELKESKLKVRVIEKMVRCLSRIPEELEGIHFTY